MSPSSTIVETSVASLADALATGCTNSVELTAKHLVRIAKYDRTSIQLNAVPLINETAFEMAQASDERRARGAIMGSLDGVPCTIKDSYKVAGLTVAAGSPAFKDLIANEDAFTVRKIKEAGAVILGLTNMPPMAAGGMQRGVYGRAESPYNAAYLTAAFASGSSNGSASATAASFGVFGMGEETISSGRSPASNNGLVAYTPSRGLISIRGNWPLFPTCDTVVPHTRTMEDMFHLLDVIVAKDDEVTGDFWRAQPFVRLPEVETIRPKSYHELAKVGALAGKKIGVPKMYIGGVDSDPSARPVHTRQSVLDLWSQSRQILESLGATVVEVDFPVVTNFERTETRADSPAELDKQLAPPHNNAIDMCKLMAYAWDDYLAANGDSNVAISLAQVDPASIFPQPPGSIPDKYDPADPLVRHTDVVAQITPDRPETYSLAGLGPALQELERTRKTDFEDWAEKLGLDAVVWPCNGDVGRADADVDEDLAREAWRNGVLFSNGNCAIRQLGIPTISVPMGIMSDTGMPVNLTFAGRAYDDNALLRLAWDYERAGRLRRAPGRTPELSSDAIATSGVRAKQGDAPPVLCVEESLVIAAAKGTRQIRLAGRIGDASSCELKVYLNGDEVQVLLDEAGSWRVDARAAEVERLQTVDLPSTKLDKTMVVLVASGKNGRSTGQMVFV